VSGMSRDEVLAAIPHRPPFLWVDEVLELEPDRIKTRKHVDPGEPFFQGHYPDFPVTPGVLVCEAIFQAGALLLSQRAELADATGKMPVLTRVKDSRFKAMVRPGDTLDVEVTVEDALSNAFHLKGEARVEGKLAVRTSFSVALVDKPES
jgi:3-hydroxyacyl-[acyl-carrier-protein] dehydratase